MKQKSQIDYTLFTDNNSVTIIIPTPTQCDLLLSLADDSKMWPFVLHKRYPATLSGQQWQRIMRQ